MATVISGSTGVNKIQDGTIVNDDINSSAAIAGTKLVMPSGSVLQVVSASRSTHMDTNSSSYTDTGLNVSITPSFTSSKILIQVSIFVGCHNNSNAQAGVKLLRDSTGLLNFNRTMQRGGEDHGAIFSLSFLDSPSTTSSINYKVQGANNTTSGYARFVRDMANTGTSTITVMEIQG